VAFLSHCGWGATSEAIVSATPVVAFPMFADQNSNALLMDLLGFAKVVGHDPVRVDMARPQATAEQMRELNDVSTRLRQSFTADGLREDIRTVITKKEFAVAAKRARSMNALFKGGAHKAAEAVEHICYGDNGNPGKA